MVAIWNFGYFENELMAEDVENVSLQHFQRPKKSFWKFEIGEIFRFIPSLSMYAKKNGKELAENKFGLRKKCLLHFYDFG